MTDRYLPFDQDKWLGPPPWSRKDPAVQAWESAHGHDARLKCYPEFGCQVIGAAAEAKLDTVRQRVLDITVSPDRDVYAPSLVDFADELLRILDS